MKTGSMSTTFASLAQAFFCRRLIDHRNASPETIASYRDTFRLLFRFLEKKRRKPATTLTLADLDANNIALFLDHLQSDRGNSIRTRNVRFAAIRSFLKFAAASDPQSLPSVQRVLAIPMKRFARPTLCFLSREEMTSIMESPDGPTWSGQRDRVLFSFLYNTGARVSEVVAVRRADVSWNSTCSVRIMGKGRKERTVPLWKTTAERVKQWLQRIDSPSDTPLFPGPSGQPLSRSGVEKTASKSR